MFATTRVAGLFFGAAAFGAGIAPVSVVAGEWTQAQRDAFTEMRNRIMALRKAVDLSTLEALGSEIEQRWWQADVELYARSMAQLCGGLGGRNWGPTKKYGLAPVFALRALEKADEISLEVECRLLGYVQFDVDEEGNTLEGDEAWAERRKETAKLLLHGWQRVEESIDPNWDPEDRAVSYVIPPNGLPTNVSPSDIEDPQLRAEYEAAIEANRRKSQKSWEQHTARKLKKYWLPGAERRILWAYMQPPQRKAELEQLLVQYEVDPATVQTMLEAVENGKMPEHLIFRNTTQPSKPGS